MKFDPSPRLPDPAAAVAALAGLSAVWGLLAIASAEWAGGGELYFFRRQAAWLIPALALGLAAWRIDFDWWLKGAPWLAALPLAALALLPWLGVTVNRMTGWYDFGWFSLQPSELGKPFFLLALVWIVLRRWQWGWRFLAGAAAAGVFAGLIALQPDFGTMMLYGAAFMLVLFLAGAPWRWLAPVLAAGPAALALAAWRFEYVRKRLEAFWSWRDDLAGTGWHWFQTQVTIARGGLEGYGLGDAWWSGVYLPLAVNDSIYAAVAETMGVIGAWAVLALWLALVWSVFRLGCAAAGPERKLFIFAAGAWLALNALVHLSVNTGLLPMTGLALPFYSYGGSSLAATFLLLGMVLSAGRGAAETGKNR